MFRLQKEMVVVYVHVHIVSCRQQVCARDKIVILLYDRLWWKRLKKDGEKKERNPTGGTKRWKKNRKVAADGVFSSSRVKCLEWDHLILEVQTLMCVNGSFNTYMA